MQHESVNWQIWIDTGGTFSDCIAISPDGKMIRVKVLSSAAIRGTFLRRVSPGVFAIRHNWRFSGNPLLGFSGCLLQDRARNFRVTGFDAAGGTITLDTDFPLEAAADFELFTGEEAPVLAARLATGTRPGIDLPPIDMRLGSTKGTNALLEKKGAKVTLLITKGFKDLVFIGTQQRPNLFELNIPDPLLLFDEVIEVPERLDASGEVVLPLTPEDAAAVAKKITNSVVAVAFLHAYRNPIHELRMREALVHLGWSDISLSHVLSSAIKIYPRTQTALVNAYLSPIINAYLGSIRESMDEGDVEQGRRLRVMTSAGGLVDAAFFQPKDSLLSGPAGGVVGAASIAAELGYQKVLSFDMGGTSTDTARYDGGMDYEFITRIGGIEMSSPTVAIETVAAGGGSACDFDGYKLVVGPESAGANPGPACYGAGGPLTITDVNLLLGKLDSSEMGIPVNVIAAERALDEIRQKIFRDSGMVFEKKELLLGFEQIANEKMAEAIRGISVKKGFDPRTYTLLAFGGAGGLHACAVASLLGIDEVIVPYDAGLLSAYGIGHARVARMASYQVLESWSAFRPKLDSVRTALEEKVFAELKAEGCDPEALAIDKVSVFLRLKGQEYALEIPWQHDLALIPDKFEHAYKKLFGYFPENRTLEVESLKVIGYYQPPRMKRSSGTCRSYFPAPFKNHTSVLAGQDVPVYRWDDLDCGARIKGPAIVLNPTSTVYVEGTWELSMQENQHVVMTNLMQKRNMAGLEHELIELELFTNRFSAIAEEMGAQLQRTSISVNIKERLDFSCALLDQHAQLLVNAPHIPVHLGSLGICARLVLEQLPMEEGDVVITNHPKYGGSHLPDITLMSPVYDDRQQLIGYVINRAHHAELGGKRPGSMPPDAKNLEEEGVVIPPTYLVKKGQVQWRLMQALLSGSAYPSRAADENIADINAALASLRRGSEALKELVRQQGLEKVQGYMQKLKDHASAILREYIQPYDNQVYDAEESMDDGHLIRVRITVKDGHISFDFSGTSPVHPGNLNANVSIVYSAVLYVLRLLCQKPIPLNEGLMQNVSIKLPDASFLHPVFPDTPSACPAVVGGNTEVSQRLVDTLLKALRMSACSQGTMNNFLFGNDTFGYYETICGGVGAGPGFRGRSAVHQHMTNTRITDPEDMELKYPVRLREFSIREGSGGRGKWPGGDGIVRELEFLDAVEMTILSQHRVVAPFGMEGGSAGACGEQYIIRANGEKEQLLGVDSAELQAGDRVVIHSPGGGAWGN